MESRTSILKNTVALAIPNILNPLISFALILVISRYLGVEGLGQYSLVFSYFGLFATLAALGLADLVVRESAKRPQDTHLLLANAGLFGTFSSLAALIGMDLLVWAMGYDEELVHASFVCSLALVASTAVSYLEAIFRSREKSEYVALCFLIENVVRVALCVGLLLWNFGIVALFAAVSLSRLFGLAVMMLFYVRIFGRPLLRYDREIWGMLYSQSAIFASIAIFSTIHVSIDQILLSKLKSVESVGIYSAADRLLTICKTVPVAFASALLPVLTRAFVTGKGEFRDLLTKSLGYLLVAILPMVVGTFILADRFIDLIYGQKFAQAAPVLQLHILSLVPFSMVFVLAQALIATENQAVDLKINIAAAIINVVLNFAFIPSLAEIGAVLATLLTIIIFNQLQNLYIKRHLLDISFIRLYFRPLAASLGMGLVTYILREWNIFLNIAISATVYVVMVVAVKALSTEEIRWLTGSMFKPR
ncbi:MAG: flippase [Desulfomonile tiedjei]|uniref:Flippase n=1 Tax=Desulfomonile tiedjei TaxID=2358 RepID=A0A9D6V036_9BACT|nr:flippase [Desulfomonile tiedjei]